MTENDYLRARTTAQDARVKFDGARQKLFTRFGRDEAMAGKWEQAERLGAPAE